MTLTTRKPRGRTSGIDWLPPFPEGWYFIATRAELAKQTLIEKKWMGEDIVAWCDDKGAFCVAEAYCPHLGSHLGPSAGGRVRDGSLVCPFHGYTFDTTGQCVFTPNAPPPKTAKLRRFPSTEIGGMIFAWWSVTDGAPKWDLPESPPNGPEWGNLRTATLRFKGHPQETTENSVDIEHLAYTHGYIEVDPKSTHIEGAYLNSAFNFTIIRRILGPWKANIDVEADVHVHGLGYSFVETYEKATNMYTRLWVLATPVDGTYIDMTLGTQVKEIRKPNNIILGLGFLPVSMRHRIMTRFVLNEEIKYVKQDVVIWERKRFQAPPRLSLTDGPIGKYRRYCRQFYPDSNEAPRVFNDSNSLKSIEHVQ